MGNNEGEITASYSTGRVSNCGAYSGHRCGDEPMGGLVGLNNGGTVTNSYWDTRTSRWTTSAGGVGRTTEQLQQPWKPVYQGIYAGWNLDLDGDGSPDDPWDFGAPDRYPKLKSPEQREQDVKTFILTPEVRFLEGRSAELTITLNRPAPAGGVAFTVTPSFNDATLRNEVASIASPVTVAAGETTVAITVAHTPDDRLDEPDKTFTVTVAATTAGWRKAGDGWDTATVTVGDDDPPGLRYEISPADGWANQACALPRAEPGPIGCPWPAGSWRTSPSRPPVAIPERSPCLRRRTPLRRRTGKRRRPSPCRA